MALWLIGGWERACVAFFGFRLRSAVVAADGGVCGAALLDGGSG